MGVRVKEKHLNAKNLSRQILPPLLAFWLVVTPVLADKALKKKDNPQLIGKRDINKGQINLYSLEKELTLGRKLAADMDRRSALVTDPILLEFVNRITQNIVIFFGGWGGFLVNQTAGLVIPLSFFKFSRRSEREADRLAAQYLWKTGYDPNGLISFFEKLRASEKKIPGTLRKVFRTHPMNRDRIEEVQKLLVRFPERREYQTNSSEFIASKERMGIFIKGRRIVAEKDDRHPF